MLKLRKSSGRLWLATLTSVLPLLGLTAQGQIINGLKAYWNFDGSFRDSINGFHGTPRGTNPVAFVDGKPGFGKAIQLNGTNFVEIVGSATNLQFANGSLSIAGWFKVDAFDKSWQALIAKGENLNYRVARRSAESTIAYAGGVGEGPDDTPAVTNGWHHFVAVTDATGARFGTALYIDGVIHGINTNKAVLAAGTSNLMIGENPEALGRQWNGAIDDIALWNRVLTEAEIATLYNGGIGTPLSTFVPATLMAFNFNEGSGTNVTSADGKLVGTFVVTNGSPTFSTDTPSGIAGDFSLQFAAGQRVNVPDPSQVLSLDPGNPSFTIEAWLKFATPSARSVFFYNNGPGGAVSASVFTNRTAFVTTLGVKDQSSMAAIPDDSKWHHMAVVHENGKEFRFYIDGVLADTQPYTGSVIFTRTNQIFYIGAENTGGLQYVGLLDRLRYSKGALAPGQLDSSPVPVTGYAAAVLADGPIAYWQFNDTSPTVALNSGRLGAAANGTYQGGAAPGAQAPRAPQFPGFATNNTAVQLNGTNGFVGTVSGLMNNRPVFTISGWIRRNANQANRTGLWGQNDLIEFGYISNNTLEVWTDNGLDITNSIPNAAWAHLAIVSTGSGVSNTMSMYTNGVLAGSRTNMLPATNAFAFNIGGGGVFDVTGNFFNGQIDDVAIFDQALSAAQIAAQYRTALSSLRLAVTNGLVAYWNFDGNLLDSIKSSHGTARGPTPVTYVDGMGGFGKAIQLNGTNFVEIVGSATNLQFANGSLSIAGWFKVDAFDKSWQALIAKGENLNYRVARRSAESTIAYAGGVGEGPDDTPAVTNGWHHFVAVTDATGARFGTALYIDGVIHGINTNKAVLAAGTSNLMIGENPEALGRQWNGAIDDIALWNRVLTDAEISSLYNGGTGTPLSTVVPAPIVATIATITRSGTTVIIQWTPAGGTLESTPSLTGTPTWTAVGTANPATITIGTGTAYYRVRK